MEESLIEKMEFQLEISQESDYEMVSDEVAKAVDLILPVIEEVLIDLKIGNQVLVIEKMELDLGLLNIYRLKEELADKFIRHFVTYLKDVLIRKSKVTFSDQALAMKSVAFFIQFGTKPWWLGNGVPRINHYANLAFETHPDQLLDLILSNYHNNHIRNRIIQNFSDILIVRIFLLSSKIPGISEEKLLNLKLILKSKFKHWDERRLSFAFNRLLIGLIYSSRNYSSFDLNSALLQAFQAYHGQDVFSEEWFGNGRLKFKKTEKSNALKGIEDNLIPNRKKTKEETLIDWLKLYLLNGYIPFYASAELYSYRNINNLFKYLVYNNLNHVVDLLLVVGKDQVVKNRFLDSISQELIQQFFAKVAPSKKIFLDWVVGVFQKVQEDFKPINQTFVRVRKSINEITFELFLLDNLSSITNENYLKLLIKSTAKKFTVRYQDLLFFVIESSIRFTKRSGVFNFHNILTKIYDLEFSGRKFLPENEKDHSIGKSAKIISDDSKAPELLELDVFPYSDFKDRSYVLKLLFDYFNFSLKPDSSQNKAMSWLNDKYKAGSTLTTEEILNLVEKFCIEFHLNPTQLIISILRVEDKNPTVKLSKSSFIEWKSRLNSYSEKLHYQLGFSKQQSLHYFFEILGKENFKPFFYDYQHYEDDILFKTLTTKYSDDFFRLLKLNQFNRELKDFILIHSPVWLKRDILNFIMQGTGLSWFEHINKLSGSFMATKWLNLNKKRCIAFIEEVLWLKIFDKEISVIEDLKVSLLDEAISQNLYNDTLINDVKTLMGSKYLSRDSLLSKGGKELDNLISVGFANYLDSFSGNVDLILSFKKPTQVTRLAKNDALKVMFEIIGKNQISLFFKDYQRLDDEGLFATLSTAYSHDFFKLLKSNQFNGVFRNFVLIHAPARLKNSILKFILQSTMLSWNQLVEDLRIEFMENNWLIISVERLRYFIELTLWMRAFERDALVKEDLMLFVLQEAVYRNYHSKKFLQDLNESQVSGTHLQTGITSLGSKLLERIFSSQLSGLRPHLMQSKGIRPQVRKLTSGTDQFKTSYLKRMFDILGREHLSSFFSDHHRYDDEILFNNLISKYRRDFLSLLKSNQFNIEFKDFVLVQAPDWLKYEILNFITKDAKVDWYEVVDSLNTDLRQQQWMKLSKKELIAFIERSLWLKAFDNIWPVKEGLMLFVLQEAIYQNVISAKLKKDFKHLQGYKSYSSELYRSIGVRELKKMSSSGILDYLGRIVSNDTNDFLIRDLFENIIWYQRFPKTHIFHDYTVLELKPYINELIKNNWRAFLTVVEKSEVMQLNIFFDNIETKFLWMLIDVKLKDQDSSVSQKNLNLILDVYKLSEDKRIHYFLKSWYMVIRSDRRRILQSSLKIYAAFLKSMLENNLISKAKLLNGTPWESLMDKLKIPQTDRSVFLKEIGQVLNLDLVFNSNSLKAKTDFESLPVAGIHQLIFSSNFPMEAYRKLIVYGLENKIFNSKHRAYLEEWTAFSLHWNDKGYLQSLIQIYLINKLDKERSILKMKSLLFYAFLENIYLHKTGSKTFLKRIQRFPVLIQGLPFAIVGNMKGETLEKWSQLYYETNPNLNSQFSNTAWLDVVLALHVKHTNTLNLGSAEQKEFFRSVIGKMPLHKLFKYDISPPFFTELPKIKSRNTLEKYFLNDSSSFFKQLNGGDFVHKWLVIFFEKANTLELVGFIRLYYQTFYGDSKTIQSRAENFFRRWLENPLVRSAFLLAYQKRNGLDDVLPFKVPAYLVGQNTNSKVDAIERTVLDGLLIFLEFGKIPENFGDYGDFVLLMSKLKGREKRKLKILVFSALRSTGKRKHLYQLLAYIDESWFLGLLHNELYRDLYSLQSTLKKNSGIDFFSDLQIRHKRDRLIMMADKWSLIRLDLFSPIEIINLVFSEWLETVDDGTIEKIFTGKTLSPLLMQLKQTNNKLKTILRNESLKNKGWSIPENKEVKEVDYGGGVTVPNAGLVLFWPFLGRFFSSLGMLDKDGIKGEEMLERAIQLLQVIATGQTEFEEWNLTLNKLLCGADPGFQVSPGITVSKEEEVMVEKLIQAAIYNWEKMRGTKPDTFRETFVNREGRLYQMENRWELIIEKRAYDVLLDTLPWNITMINLSWMKTRLNVIWKY